MLRCLLTCLCHEALIEESESNPPVTFFTRAPEGKTIAQEATTISLNQQGYGFLREIIDQLRHNKKWAVELSKEELEQEVVTALFEGTSALQEGNFDVDKLIESLLDRLGEGVATWEVYIPIANLELPEGSQLSLAGGMFKELTSREKDILRGEHVGIWRQAKWETPEKMESGMKVLAQSLEETITSSKFWYCIQVNGRAQAARSQAIEAAMLAMDILCFFALFNGINPEVFAPRFPNQTGRGIMNYIQIVKGQSCQISSELGIPFSYGLDAPRFNKLTRLAEFQKLQQISNKSDPSQLEQKFLLGVQQYAEATRLPSASLRLVWYLSALETVLAKENEQERHQRHEKVGKRLRKLLGATAADMVGPLYNKRRKPVHYGHRNRIGNELITDAEIQRARTLAYLGIVSALSKLDNHTDHNVFLDYLDALP